MGRTQRCSSNRLIVDLFEMVGVTVTPTGLCECGETLDKDAAGVFIGTRARAHFIVCPAVLANILAAQEEV